MTISAAQVEAGSIEVALTDGRRGVFHGLALRDACPCSACRLPSGQRLFESHQTLPGIDVESAAVVDGGVEIRFSDGHAAFFPESLIGDEVTAYVSGHRRRRDVRLWGSELVASVPEATFDDVRGIPDHLRRWLGPIAEVGVGLLRDVPLPDGTVAEVAELFSSVRVTNYGRVFDVTVRVDATNLADSAFGLSLHTDNPYRSRLLPSSSCTVSRRARREGRPFSPTGFVHSTCSGRQIQTGWRCSQRFPFATGMRTVMRTWSRTSRL